MKILSILHKSGVTHPLPLYIFIPESAIVAVVIVLVVVLVIDIGNVVAFLEAVFSQVLLLMFTIGSVCEMIIVVVFVIGFRVGVGFLGLGLGGGIVGGVSGGSSGGGVGSVSGEFGGGGKFLVGFLTIKTIGILGFLHERWVLFLLLVVVQGVIFDGGGGGSGDDSGGLSGEDSGGGGWVWGDFVEELGISSIDLDGEKR
ncbi:hypothetical protein M5689_008862 [Euphorbia peplus]|nr:hypothetical protein M5689_008862 [Euphorbia peplus]